MMIFGQLQTGLVIRIHVSMSLGYQCRALTQLGSQNFDIRLEIESQVGTPILQTLKASLRLTQEKIENHIFALT